MWCGTLIFASQAPGEEGFVIFLSVVVATANVSMMLWLVFQLVSECAYENKDSKFGTAVFKRVQSIRHQTFRRRSSRSSAESYSVNEVVIDSTEIGIELQPETTAAARIRAPQWAGGNVPQKRSRVNNSNF